MCGQETRGHVAGMSKTRETAGTRGQQSLGVAGVERRQKPGAVGSGRRENPPPSRSLTQSRCLTKVSASHVLHPGGSTRGYHPDPGEGVGSHRTLTLELLPGASQQLVEDVEAAFVLGLADGPRLLQQVWVGGESRCRMEGTPRLSRGTVESLIAPAGDLVANWTSGFGLVSLKPRALVSSSVQGARY